MTYDTRYLSHFKLCIEKLALVYLIRTQVELD
jgi:hypothetical protein